VRTLIVDDHPLFSGGLRLLLLGSPTFDDIVCCEDGSEALRLAEETPFDLVLLDWNLGSEPAGRLLVERLKMTLPQARVVIVSGESSALLVRQAIESGAVGYVPKESTSSLLIDALNITAHGGIYLPASVLSDTAAHLPSVASTPAGSGLRTITEAYPRLTPRQAEVLSLLVRGLQNKQIAREMKISDGTVKQHINVILRELEIGNRTEAVYLLSRQGVRFD